MTDTKDDAAPARSEANETAVNESAPRQPLAPAAQRALAEAAARRAERARTASQPPEEIAGRGGLDPARYGDWEVDGKASDF
jgi:hypothetical protein